MWERSNLTCPVRLKEGCVRSDLSHTARILPGHETSGLPSRSHPLLPTSSLPSSIRFIKKKERKKSHPLELHPCRHCVLLTARSENTACLCPVKYLPALIVFVGMVHLCLFLFFLILSVYRSICDCSAFKGLQYEVCSALSHSEWAQRVASGLERRPRQNGAGATPQWDRTGDYHKGKDPLQRCMDLVGHVTLIKL